MKRFYGSVLIVALSACVAAHAADIKHLPTKGKSGSIGGEVTLTYEIESPEPPPSLEKKCNAQVEISYSQRNETVRVEASIVNEDCAVSRGEYSVQFRTRDETGDIRLLSFDESWAQGAEARFKSNKDYEIGSGVELVWARVNRVSCSCSDRNPNDE